ncbi:BMP family lipoprotein [Maridesulfovibrio sp. FT414]|uniref:BMP family lipoprotein n=1 Tax=Maridesulfovibrio sp. FT414 TaxID=2979469 RepID=UPI003D8005AD
MASGSALDDDSFNGMTVSGLRRLQQKFDLHIEVRAGGFAFADQAKQLQSLLDSNAHVIVINSSKNIDEILGFAGHHPEIRFIINDASVRGYDNVSSIAYGQGMGSCLVGALCAWQTKTGKVGFIGGNENSVIQDFLSGFRAGVELSGKDVSVEVKFIRCGSAVEGFEDPQQASLLARRMYASGVDIIYAVAGLSGNGVIQAARKTGNYVVGVDSNQDHMAKGTILTSMMKRLDVAVYNEVLSVLEGRFVPGPKNYDLSNDGVCLTDMKYSRHLISKEVLHKLDGLKEKLVSGTVRLDFPVK